MSKLSDAVRARADALTGAGHIAPSADGFASGAAEDVAHAARVRMQLRATNPAQIEEARFLAFGCPSVIACASWYAEHLTGGPLLVPDPDTAARALELHPDRAYAADLAARAAAAAIADWHARQDARRERESGGSLDT